MGFRGLFALNINSLINLREKKYWFKKVNGKRLRNPQNPHTQEARMTTFAERFLQHGFSVVPMVFQSKQPAVKWIKYRDHQAPTELVNFWFGQNFNLGIVTGFNNLVVIDFDDFGEYLRWKGWIGGQETYSLASRAFTVRSSRGMHVYFRTLRPERNRHLGKIDIKGQWGLVTGPGSTHASGAVYTPLNDFFVPTIVTLSDVLPSQLLLSVQDVSPIVKPLAMPPQDVDVWQVVNSSGATPGMDLIAAIRAKFKIEDFFKTPFTKTGPYFVTTQCPFHDDQKPSFWIDTEHQVCNCFVCNFPKPLDVINLYGILYGLNNRDAILTLARLL